MVFRYSNERTINMGVGNSSTNTNFKNSEKSRMNAARCYSKQMGEEKMDIQGFRVRKSILGRVENIKKKAWLYVGKISGPVTFQPTQLFSCMESEIQQERNWTAESFL